MFHQTLACYGENHMELAAMTTCPRSTVTSPQRASSDRVKINALIDRLKTGHVAFVEDGEPRCIPLTVWRLEDNLYLHVLNGGRLSKRLMLGRHCVFRSPKRPPG